MKKTLFLSLALASCSLAGTEIRLLNGVTTESGYFDVSKYLVRDPNGSVIDSQTCAAVTASNMLAYWYSQHPEATKETVDTLFANGIYDYIFDYTKNASTTISADCNYYASNHNQASAPAVCTTATYVPKNEGFKVDATPEGYALTGSLYTSMSLQDAIQWGLDNNLAMGLTMNQDPGRGAHALTIWGGQFTSYGEGSPVQMDGIYYTNSDNAEGMNYASFSTAFNKDGDTEFFFNDGSGRRWKVVELTFLLDPYATAPENPDNNKVYIGKGEDTTGYYCIGGIHENATSFRLNGNATLIIGEGMELSSSQLLSEDKSSMLTAELSGKGTYIAEKFQMGYAKLGKDWNGTVRLTGVSDTLSAATLDSAAVNGSVAELNAAIVGDWKENVATIKSALKLTNDSDLGTPALSITAADGTKNITFAGEVSGTGDIRLADDKGVATHSYTFSGDVQKWSGSVRSVLSENAELYVYFKENKEVNANVENAGAGKVSVSFEKGAVINGNLLNLDKGTLMVTAEDGTTFNGDLKVDTLILNGQVTINQPAGESKTKSAPSADPDFTNVEHFSVKELSFNSGSSLTLNGDFDLSKTTITLSQDYLNSLTSGSAATLISTAPGSTISGMATLSGAPAGYKLALDGSGNLILQSESSLSSTEFTLASALLTGNELTLTPAEEISSDLVLGALDRIEMAVNSAIINDLIAAGADPNALVSITIGTAKDLTNITFIVDGKASYSGEGNGLYRLGTIPEPATASLSLLALTALAARRKRR